MSPQIHILRRLVEISSGLLWAIGLSGCTYQGHIDEPVTLKATWYSFWPATIFARPAGPTACLDIGWSTTGAMRSSRGVMTWSGWTAAARA